MKNRSAFSLLDTLVGVALATFAVAMSVPLIRWCSADMHYAQTDAARAASFDHAMDVLRHDAWQARNIRCLDSRRAVLAVPDGKITWSINAAGIVRRRGPAGDEQKWQAPAVGVRFESAGSLLAVNLLPSGDKPAVSLGMISPASLYIGEHP